MMDRAIMGGEQVGIMCGVSGGWWGGGGGMWSRHTFSLTRLEPTRTGVGSPGAKMGSVVGVRRQEPEVWRRGGESERGKYRGQIRTEQGKGGEGSEGVRRIER